MIGGLSLTQRDADKDTIRSSANHTLHRFYNWNFDPICILREQVESPFGY